MPEAHDKPQGVSRRDFLRRGSAGIVGVGAAMAAVPAGLLAGEAEPKIESRNKQPGLRYTVLGRAGWEVSRLGFGGFALTAANRGVLEAAIERGVNLFHIARSYVGGQAIKAAGPVIKANRDKLFLVIKGEPDQEIDNDLRTLGVEMADIVMPQIESAEQAARPDRVEQFLKLQQAGKVRKLGLTAHSQMAAVVGAGMKVDDVVLIMTRYEAAARNELDPRLKLARERRIGTMAMKVFLGIDDHSLYPATLKDLYARGQIDLALLTPRNHEELDAWLKVVGELPDRAEIDALNHYMACHLGEMCTGCGACQGCPQGIRIGDILRYSRYYAAQCGDLETARELYRTIAADRTAPGCRDCGRCERVCPNHVPVRQFLRDAHRALA